MQMMIDLETFSSDSYASIVQIGAIVFGNDFKEVDSFFINVEHRHNKELGFHEDKDTILWWAEQSPEAIRALCNPHPVHIEDALKEFIEFYKSYEIDVVWSHATFDFVILSNAMKKLGIEMPWRYSGYADLRTVAMMAKKFAGFDVKKVPFEGITHNAIDDCSHQIKYLREAYDAMFGFVEIPFKGDVK
jgi:DNA polymerase III epsilon subunit-like protein